MAWEWLEKYLKGGMATQGVPDVVGGEVPTRGLFGTGGNFGQGGLLTTFNQNPNASNNMFQMLSNPAVGIGASIFTKGMKGQDIGTSAFPAIKEGISFSESAAKLNIARKRRKYIEQYKDQIPKKDMELFMAFPIKYITGIITKKFSKDTASLNPTIKKLLNDSIEASALGKYDEWLDGLSEGERGLFKSKILGKKTNVQEFFTNLPNIKKDKTKTYSKDQERKIKMTMNANINADGSTITRAKAIKGLEEANQL